MSATRVLFDAPGPRARARHRIIAAAAGLGLLAIFYWLYTIFLAKGQLTGDKWGWLLTTSAWTNYYLPGILDTIRAAVIAIVLSMVLALGLAMARMSDIAPLRWAAGVFVEFFRAVPVLIMMLFVFYGLSNLQLTPNSINPLLGVVTGLTLYNAAVLGEVIRNGVGSLPAGQREAGLSVGLSPSQVRRSILVPQALTAMLPTLVSQLIVITKDTALGYLILYSELLRRAGQVGSSESALLPAFAVAAVLFILINYGIGKIAELVEARQRRTGHTAGQVGDPDDVADMAGGPPSLATQPSQ